MRPWKAVILEKDLGFREHGGHIKHNEIPNSERLKTKQTTNEEVVCMIYTQTN